MAWPPDWDRSTGPEGRRFPPPGWPSKPQLDYTQQAIVLGLLLLALPWLVTKLVSDPGAVLSGLGRGIVRKGPGA